MYTYLFIQIIQVNFNEKIGQDPVGAMKLLEELSLFEITFKLPDKLNHDNYSKPCIHMISAAFELLNDLNDKVSKN